MIGLERDWARVWGERESEEPAPRRTEDEAGRSTEGFRGRQKEEEGARAHAGAVPWRMAPLPRSTTPTPPRRLEKARTVFTVYSQTVR